MKIRKLVSGILASCLLLVSALAPACMAEAEEKVLNVAYMAMPSTLDSSIVSSVTDQLVQRALVEPLICANAQGALDLAAGLAEAIDANETRTAFTVHLVQNCVWENGDPVTANDIYYSITRALDPATAAPYVSLLFSLVNAQAFYTGQAQLSDLGVTVVDDYTLELNFANPVMNISEEIGSGLYFPLNQKFVEECGDKYATAPEYLLSCGPFKCTEMSAEKLVFTRNESYYEADQVDVDSIVFWSVADPATRISLFEEGTLDLAASDSTLATQYAGAAEERIVPIISQALVHFNMANSCLANKNIRLALCRAIDVPTEAGVVNPTYIPATSVGIAAQTGPDAKTYGEFLAGETLVEYDPEAAKAYLAAGLEELGMTAEELSAAITLSAISTYGTDVQVLSAMWKDVLGLDIAINLLPDTEYMTLVQGDYDIMIMSWSVSTDPVMLLAFFSDLSGMNVSGYQNEEFNNTLMAAYADGSSTRYDKYLALEKILFDDGAVLPLWTQTCQYLISTKLGNVAINPLITVPEYKFITME